MEKTAFADPFLNRLAVGIRIWPKSRRALIAVSGGRDSVALLHGLHKLGYRKLIVVHLNHQLRGTASQADAKFVERLACKLGYPNVISQADVQSYAKEYNFSIEHAARELRLDFFANVARRLRCYTVLLAHHADDQVETCLFNFLRGSGAAGLAGMRPDSTQKVEKTQLRLLRPMLNIRRIEIDTYLQSNQLVWREDVSNSSSKHTRNRLRQCVLPVLEKEFGPSFSNAVLRSASIFAAEEDWMRSQIEDFVLEKTLSVRALLQEPLAIRRRIVRRWLRNAGVSSVGFAEVERLLTLLDITRGPAKINLPDGTHARRRQNRIFLE